jgi:putative Mn2+ efflux pump MntP
MPILPLLVFILPLGLDTLGVSISLGIKSRRNEILEREKGGSRLPTWLSSAILFSLAEAVMPLAGLAIGYATSLLISNIMHVLGPLLLIGVGAWELQEEAQEYIKKKKGSKYSASGYNAPSPSNEQFKWRRQLLLAISISLDELAIGFSLGTITVSHWSGKPVNPFALCILIGIQGFLMTLIGIALGRTLRTRLKALKEWTELLSAFLLIGLGIWLLLT